MSCLDGEAEQLVEGFPIDNQFYNEVWKFLEDRYGNPQIIFATLHHELVQLSPKNKRIRLVRGNIERILRYMANLGEDFNTSILILTED
ncbi:unnamed protein product [Dracunculus medinensis]|uniref:Barstar domain-containing protein n=1 Tax=Dracunculus medinensis TaxID=318479 RepID=A0A0N4UN26_DRAME|nr:unnamed protein product [Dracunculus medinensis]